MAPFLPMISQLRTTTIAGQEGEVCLDKRICTAGIHHHACDRGMVAGDAACGIRDVLVEDRKPFDCDGHLTETVEHEMNCAGDITTWHTDIQM